MNLTAYDLTVDMLDVHAVSLVNYFEIVNQILSNLGKL